MSLNLLKKACKLYGQRKTGAMIGKSATTVNMILKCTYPNQEKILQRVGEVFADLNKTEFECPVIGEIHVDVCRKYQEMAKQGKVHKDRIYMQVRTSCNECRGVFDD